MKKSILLLCLLLANTASAAGISLGMYDGKEYVLQTDSVRFCSTPSCLYIDGQPQSYVAASIMVHGGNALQSGDALSYNKQEAYSIKSVLFAVDGSKFVLVGTTAYDVNGNPIGIKDETVEMIEVETATIAKSKETGREAVVTSNIQEKRRKIAWSIPHPGSPGAKITAAVLEFAESNYHDILARSKSENSMSVK